VAGGAEKVPFDSPLPWLEAAWERLRLARASDRLAHGLLVTGPRGVGKRHLVEMLVRVLLCASPRDDGVACGACADCRLADSGSHPDLLRLGPDPESKSGEIRVEAIRELADRASLTAIRAPRKVVVIDPADRMNTAAANALLKTLEEPPGATLLCLIGEQPERLPATVRSRCQPIRIPTPPSKQALDWLSRTGQGQNGLLRLSLGQGAPLRAASEIDEPLLEQRRALLCGFLAVAEGEQDPVVEAAAWNRVGVRPSLEWLAGWLCDLLRLATSSSAPRLDNPDMREPFTGLAARLEAVPGHRYLRRVIEARALTETTVNPLLLLESLLIEWSKLVGPRP
jgi:DNA polymerase-3 subunit delta'